MHYHLGSREPGQNIAIARNHGRWKGTTRQDCEQQRGFRECDSERANLTVAWMWHIKLNGGCEVGWSLEGDWWPSCSHSSSGSCHVKCSKLNWGDWLYTVKCFYVLVLFTWEHVSSFLYVIYFNSENEDVRAKNKGDIVRPDKVAEHCALTGTGKGSIMSPCAKGHYILKNRNAVWTVWKKAVKAPNLDVGRWG